MRVGVRYVRTFSYHEEGPPRLLWVAKGRGILWASKSAVTGSEVTSVECGDFVGRLIDYWTKNESNHFRSWKY